MGVQTSPAETVPVRAASAACRAHLNQSSREAAEAWLKPCLDLTAGDAVQRLGLASDKWSWSDEPPAVRASRATYWSAEKKRWLTLYIAEGEPLYRQFNERGDWDYAAFLACRVGGIQYHSGDVLARSRGRLFRGSFATHRTNDAACVTLGSALGRSSSYLWSLL